MMDLHHFRYCLIPLCPNLTLTNILPTHVSGHVRPFVGMAYTDMVSMYVFMCTSDLIDLKIQGMDCC